jgi:hypothetical protein
MYSLPFFGMTGGGGGAAPTFDDAASYLQFLGANLWLDAADATTVLTTNNLVTEWRDKSGNNRHATQGNTARQPAYQNNAIVFTSDALQLSLANPSTLDVFYVFKPYVSNFNGLFDSAPGQMSVLRQSNGEWERWSRNPFITLNATVNASNLIYLSNVSNSNIEYYRNGSFITRPALSGTWAWSANQFIGSVNNNTFYSGEIQEVIFFYQKLSDSDRQIIEGYLAHKWNLVASLPNEHPYRFLAPAILPTQLQIEATTPFLNIETEAQTFTFTVYRGGNPNKESSVNYTTTATNRLTVVATDFVGNVFPSGTLTFALGETTKTITIQLKQSDSSKKFAVTLSGAINADIVSGSATAIGLAGLEGYLIGALNTNLWLDAADATTVLTTNNLVTQWSDKSGKENDLVQATSSSQPTYANNTVSFTLARFLAITSKQVFAGATSGSVFFVGRQPVAEQSAWGRFGLRTDIFTPFQNDGIIYDAFLNPDRTRSQVAIQHPLPLSIISFEHNGTSVRFRRNGADLGFGNIGFRIPLASINEQRLGGVSGRFDHQEILMFPSVLSDSDRQIIEGYLAHKWNLVASLPNNHPYKSLAPAISPAVLRIEATTPSLNIETEAQTFTFTVYRGGNPNKESSVTYTTTATNRLTVVATDFVGDIFPSGTVTFAVGETTKTITIQLKQSDSSKEFAVTLSGAVNADIASGSATAIGVTDLEGYLIGALNTNLWLDAADSTTVLTTNNLVTQWSDKSGNNKHATQSNTARQPAYVLNNLNGLNTISLTQDELNIPNMLLTGTGWDVFAVASMLSGTNQNGRLISMRQQGQSGDWNHIGSWVPICRNQFNNSIVSVQLNSLTPEVPIALNTLYIIQSSLTNTSINVYLDGILRSTRTGASSLNTTDGMMIGESLNVSVEKWDGTIAEIIITPLLIESDRQIIEGYLAHKWNLVASLPNNHPYKSVAPF